MKNLIPEPSFEGFDGIYAGSKSDDFIMPPNEIDFSSMVKYMRETKKSFNELSEEEVNRFRFA